MVKIIREADSAPVAAVTKKHGVLFEPTIYAWRKRFGTLEAMDVKKMKAVEQENARLKKLLAEPELDIEVTKEISRGKCQARPSVAERWRTRSAVASPSDGRARCSGWPGLRFTTNQFWLTRVDRAWSR